MEEEKIIRNYEEARERYAGLGVDVDAALKALHGISLSLHCWQTDDVAGFECNGGALSGGIQVTGNFPGKARNIDEVRADIEKVKTLVPGNHRLSLHAIYGDFNGEKVDRNEIEPRHFQSWIDWAKATGMKLDFNSTSFSHPKSGNMTLANRDKKIRDFWIEHTIRSRRIADEIGRQLDDMVCHNLWIHDGSKDTSVDCYYYRYLLKEYLPFRDTGGRIWMIRRGSEARLKEVPLVEAASIGDMALAAEAFQDPKIDAYPFTWGASLELLAPHLADPVALRASAGTNLRDGGAGRFLALSGGAELRLEAPAGAAGDFLLLEFDRPVIGRDFRVLWEDVLAGKGQPWVEFWGGSNCYLIPLDNSPNWLLSPWKRNLRVKLPGAFAGEFQLLRAVFLRRL